MRIAFPSLLFCLLVPAGGASLAARRPAPPEPLRLTVSPQRRTWSLEERVGSTYRVLLRDARVRVSRADGSEVAWTSIRRSPDGRSFTMEAPDISVKVLAQWLAPRHLPTTVSLLPIAFPKRPGVQLREVRVADGALLPTVGPGAVVLNNGYQSWSRTTVTPLDADAPVSSWWVAALKSARHSFVAGYLSSVLGQNTLVVSRGPSGIALSDHGVVRRLSLARVAGGTPLDALYLSWGKSPTGMLAEYAAGTRVFTDIMDPAPSFTPQPVPQGWCSWYEFYANITEPDVVANVEAARRAFSRRQFGIVQLDDGFQIAAGEWETNGKLPGGHRGITGAIHARGYKAGLWLAPFAVGERSRLFREHPEYLLKGADGKPVRMASNPGWGGAVYSLDPSLQPVRAWLKDLFRTVTRDWGYDYVKIDFLYYPLVEEGAPAGAMTPVQAYRAALKAIRAGAGPNVYILACGAPLGPTIGLVNGNRIGPDVNTSWPGIVEAARDTAYRQWMHNVWWQNDPDALIVRPPLTADQARAWTAAVGLSGGLAMLSDDLTKLPPDRLALDRMALPVSANGDAPPFGSTRKAPKRATGMRLADMWEVRGAIAPSLTGPGISVSLRPEAPAGPGGLTWFLHTGDDREWARPETAEMDNAWRRVAPGVPWEAYPGLADYDGYAWYRVRFRMPAGARRQDLTLNLGRIDDVDETFVNGERVGASGSFPPRYESAVTRERHYRVPADALRWEPNAENILAIRVYDGGGDGGLIDLGAEEPPAIWWLPSDVSAARITVAGLFNWSDLARVSTLSPAALGAAPRGKRAHVWDVWSGRYLGATTGAMRLEVAPTSCRLLAIAPDVGHPQVLGTDAHVTAGAASITGVRWDGRHRALIGCSKVAPGQPFRLALTVPSGLGLFRLDASGAAVERLPSAPGSALFRITPRTEQVTWTARYAPG